MLRFTKRGCLIWIIGVILVGLSAGSICFDYCLFACFGKDIPWYGDMVGGLFLGWAVIPATVICWIVKMCGVAVPFFVK